MATTYGADRERRARAPAVPRDVNPRRRQVVLLLGTLTASVSYSAGLSPPGWLWLDNGGGHTAGDPLLYVTHPRRYLMFFYCRVTAFVAPLAVILLHLLPANLISSNQRIKWYARWVAMALSLLALIGRTYVAVSTFTFMSSAYVDALAAAVVLYIATHILVFSSELVEISLSSMQETPQKCPKLLRSKKKKYLLKMEQKDHQHGSGDAFQILKRSRMHLLLLGTLTASVTYQAGLSPWAGFWQRNVVSSHMQYLVFIFFNASAFVVSLAILPILILSIVSSTQGIKYYCALQVGVTLDLLSLIGAYVARSWQLSKSWSMSMLVGWVSLYVVVHVVVFLLQVFLACALWQRALREKMKHYPPGWLKKLFGLSIDEPADDDDDDDNDDDYDDDDDEKEEEEEVIMEGKQEKRRKLLLLLAILAAILAYHASTSPRPDNLVNHRLMGFQYCKVTVFITSICITAMLANTKLPEERCVRWYVLRVCVILEVIGLMGALVASCYRKISTMDVLSGGATMDVLSGGARNRQCPRPTQVVFLNCSVQCYSKLQYMKQTARTPQAAAPSAWGLSPPMDVLILVLAVLLCIAVHFTMLISGTVRGLVQRSSQLFVGADPLPEEEDDGSEDELEFGIAGGTNEEPLGLEISSPILGGALTLILAVPVMAILANPVKLLVAIMIASIGVSLWRRSLARLLRALARALQRRCTANLPTDSGSTASSTHREQLVSAICQGLCKVIHTLCVGTWMWILILVIWVPSLRHSLKLKFKMSKISAVLGVLVVSAPTMATATAMTDTPDAAMATATATGTSTTTTLDTPSTATSSTVTGTQTTAATNASSTTMGDRKDDPLVVPRPRRNRRPNSRLIGDDWIN